MELWQIASLLGEDENPTDPKEISRRFQRERARARREGRELDAEALVTPMTDTDMRAVLTDSDNRGQVANGQ